MSKIGLYILTIGLCLHVSCKNNESSASFINQTYVYLPVIIDDSLPCNLMFDTGTKGLILDSSFFSKTKIFYSDLYSILIEGSGEKNEKIPYVENPIKVKFNESVFTSTFTLISNLKSIHGKKIDGIIGWDFFKTNVVEIDYRNSKFNIINELPIVYRDSGIKIPFRIMENVISIEAELLVNQTIEINGQYAVDLGFDGYTFLTSQTSKKFHLDTLFKKTILRMKKSGFGDASSGFFFRGKEIRLQDKVGTEPLIACSNNLSGALSNAKYLGLLGNSFFKKFNIAIDFSNQFMYLIPHNDFHLKHSFTNLGMAFIDRTDIYGGYIITILHENSQADKAGLKFGDIITHFNNKPANQIGYIELKEMLKEPGKSFLLKIKRGDAMFNVTLTSVEG